MTNNQKLSCLIIEDEPIAAEILQDYIQQVPSLELKGIYTDAITAMDVLAQESIDVIFLDIHLPKLKGLDFLKLLDHKPQTILTTAYNEYALDAFEEDVVDYLLKPIEFTRFLKAVNKLKGKRRVNEIAKSKTIQSNEQRPFQFFNVNRKMIKVYFDDILYIESLKDYSKIYTSDSSLVTRGQIGDMEVFFKKHNFLRIHRSFIVSVDKIKSYSATEIEVTGKSLPIGRSYKEIVAQALSNFYIDKE